MNRLFLLAALAAALVLPASAQTVDFCFVINENGFTVDGVVDSDSDAFDADGTTTTSTEWLVSGSRGTTGQTIRHHSFTFMNYDIVDGTACSGSNALVDWLTYNGQITGGNASSGYNWRGRFLNSCGVSGGLRTGLITLGNCPAPRPGPVGREVRDDLAPDAALELGAAPAPAVQAAPASFEVTAAPNPFAAGTVVQFDLPEAQHVRVVVFDALGRQVAVLADEERAAGTHAVGFEGASLPAGTYLYRVEAGTNVASGRMTLVR